MIAYCFTSGVIHFGRKLPKGAIEIANLPGKKLRQIISVAARWSYPSKPGADDEVPLVPGIPEAKNQSEKLDALLAFRKQVEARIAKLPSQVPMRNVPELVEQLIAKYRQPSRARMLAAPRHAAEIIYAMNDAGQGLGFEGSREERRLIVALWHLDTTFAAQCRAEQSRSK
jgi:hypothetical protein